VPASYPSKVTKANFEALATQSNTNESGLATEVTDRAAGDTSTQAYSVQRANHTGTQLAATISDFDAAAVAAGSGTYVASPTTAGITTLTELQTQVNTVAALGGRALSVAPGTNIDFAGGTLTLPRGVSLLGLSTYGTRFFSSTTQATVNVTGGYTSWAHRIEGVTLDKVKVTYGTTTADYANGATLRSCELLNSDTAVTYANNAWITRIDDCRIHNCTTGVSYSFANTSNSGANCVISNSAIYNMTGAGVVLTGAAADGYDLAITNTDIEHCATSVQTLAAAGDGTITITNGHFEQNTSSYIDNAGGTRIYVTGLWAYDGQAGFGSHFINSNANGGIYINSGRVAWGTTAGSTFCKITAGTVFVNVNQVTLSGPTGGLLLGGITSNPAGSAVYAAGSTAGLQFPKGLVAAATNYTGVIAQGASTTLGRLVGGDTGRCELVIQVKVSAATTASAFAIFYNPGGTLNTGALTLPNVAGALTVRIVFDYQYARCYWQFLPSAAGNAVGGVVDTNISAQPLTTDKFVDYQNAGTGGTGSQEVFDVKLSRLT
jgi:hypothetical protein